MSPKPARAPPSAKPTASPAKRKASPAKRSASPVTRTISEQTATERRAGEKVDKLAKLKQNAQKLFAEAEERRKAEELYWANTDGRHGTPYYCSGRPRPLLRGCLHLYTAYLFPVWAGYQLSLCHSYERAAAVGLACFGAVAMLGASGTYHRYDWKTEQREEIAGLCDYAGIYLQIAFSATPMWLLLLPAPYGWAVITSCALCAAAGIRLTFSPVPISRHAGTFLYILMGAAQGLPLKWFGVWSQLNQLEQSLCLICMGSYLIGSQIYTHATPKLWQRTFGFHELWHLLVVIGSICSYAVNNSLLMRLP